MPDMIILPWCCIPDAPRKWQAKNLTIFISAVRWDLGYFERPFSSEWMFERGTQCMHTASFQKLFGSVFYLNNLQLYQKNVFLAQILKATFPWSAQSLLVCCFSSSFAGFCGKQTVRSLFTSWFPSLPPIHTAFLSLLKGDGSIPDLHHNELRKLYLVW